MPTPKTNIEGWEEILKNPPKPFKQWFDEERRFLKKHIKKNDLVLDVGCGDGRTLKDLIPITTRLVGIDHNPKAVRLARKNLKNNARILLADGKEIPFPRDTFDAVICIGTVANFGKTKIKILKEMKRVCKSGKKILISVYSDEALDERLKLYRTIRADIKEIKNDGTITFDEKDVVDVISEQFSKKQLILFAKKNRIECDQNQENQKKNRLFVRIHQSGLAMK